MSTQRGTDLRCADGRTCGPGTQPEGARRPWVIVTDYPRWPSPYFAQFARYAPPDLQLRFASTLDAADEIDGGAPPCRGVVNLHRLKRLYRDTSGARTKAAASAFLGRLEALHGAGWRIAWTIHNLLPIDGGPPTAVDWAVADGVLSLADVVICHTHADAAYITGRGVPGRVVVAGRGGLPTSGTREPDRAIVALAERMRRHHPTFLLFGHMTAYKALPATFAAFVADTESARLIAVGPCADGALARDLEQLAGASGGRIHLEMRRVDPADARHLYAAAAAAVCPYSSDGPYAFFARVLHPSSITTAVVFGVPVIAPALPAIIEMSAGHPRVLYAPADAPGPAFKAAERLACGASAGAWTPGRPAAAGSADDGGWARVTGTYMALANDLLGGRGGLE